LLDFFDEDMLQLFEVERDPGRIASREGRGKVETGFPLASCSKLIESIQNHCDLCVRFVIFLRMLAPTGRGLPSFLPSKDHQTPLEHAKFGHR